MQHVLKQADCRGLRLSSDDTLQTALSACAAPLQMEGGDDMGRQYLLYNMTKAAVLHGVKMQLADPAIASRHITIAAICPGWCKVSVLDTLFTTSVEPQRLVFRCAPCWHQPHLVLPCCSCVHIACSLLNVACLMTSFERGLPHELRKVLSAEWECHLRHAWPVDCMLQHGCSSVVRTVALDADGHGHTERASSGGGWRQGHCMGLHQFEGTFLPFPSSCYA